jgi:putative transposase
MKIEFDNLYTHFVFNTLNQQPLIQEINRERVEKYVTGIVNNNNSKMFAIYMNPDHLHFITSRSPKISEEYLATIVADSSTKFINKNKLCSKTFEWQQSGAAFSVSKSDVDKVCKYILNQKEHHKKVTFKDEYNAFMNYYLKKGYNKK